MCLFVVCLSVCLLFFVLICLFICLNVTLIIICHEFDTQIRVDLVIRHHKIGICPLFLIASFSHCAMLMKIIAFAVFNA